MASYGMIITTLQFWVNSLNMTAEVSEMFVVTGVSVVI